MSLRRVVIRLLAQVVWLVPGCTCESPEGGPAESISGAPSAAGATQPSAEPTLKLLYLPDGGDVAPATAPVGQGRIATPATRPRCPPAMVSIGGRFCIDRYEAVLADASTGQLLSPYYHPTLAATQQSYRRWREERRTSPLLQGREMPVPVPPSWQLEREAQPRAESRSGLIPHGYLSGDVAQHACQQAGKRLCTEPEWVQACRGEGNTKFPYGDDYVQGACNVFRPLHPAQVLHGDASSGHSDPRLNQVQQNGRRLLRATGSTPRCRSRWGDDGVFDMVGNLAEWVDDEDGVFVGGFYARSTRAGCERRVSVHARGYFDYSLGMRCCRSQ